MARRAAPSEGRAGIPRVARAADSSRGRHRGAAPLRDRRRRTVRLRRRRDRAGGASRGALARERGRPRTAAHSRRGKSAEGGLRLRQRRHAGRARRVRGGRHGAVDPPVRRILAAVVLAGGIGVAFLTLQTSRPGWWERLWYPLRYEQVVRGHAHNYDLGPALLAAVIYQESKFKANARSKSGAIGLMQLLPDTAMGIAVHTGGTRFTVTDLYNPEIKLRYGAWYLQHLMQKYLDERTALAAYNAGQDNVDRWRAAGRGIEFSETRAYVDRVEQLKKIYRDAYGTRLGH